MPGRWRHRRVRGQKPTDPSAVGKPGADSKSLTARRPGLVVRVACTCEADASTRWHVNDVCHSSRRDFT